jgi:RNA polymerase sigma factor (sigma-70 family)
MQERVRAALDVLRHVDRTVLVMRYLEHLSLKEISEATQTTVAAVKMRHARALQRLERVLRDLK